MTGERDVHDIQANSQVLGADGQVLIRKVTINGAPYWQASNGRTFPQVAGAEDPLSGANTEIETEAGQESADDYDKERGFRKIQAQAADLQRLKAERDALKAQAKELETLKAKDAQREREKLSETERLAAEKAELERKLAEREAALRETRTEQALEREATAHGARKPGIVVRLIDRTALQYDDNGIPTNADKLVKKLLEDEPYLIAAATETTAAAPRGNAAGPRPAGQQTIAQAGEELFKRMRESTPTSRW